MNSYKQMLLQPLHEQRNVSSLWVTWLVLGLGTVGGLVSWLVMNKHDAALFIAGIAVVMSALMWCGLLLKSLIFQNSPINARLLPGLRPRLIKLTVATWLAFSLLLSGLLSIIKDRGDLIFVLVVLAILCASLMVRYTWMRFLPIVWIISNQMLSSLTPSFASIAATLGETRCILIIGGLDIVLAAFTLHVLYPQGGERHWAWHEQMKRIGTALRSGASCSDMGVSNTMISKASNFGYFSSLERDCRKRASGKQLLPYVLGVSSHWVTMLIIPCLLILAAILVNLWGGFKKSEAMHVLVSPMLVFYTMLPVMIFVNSFSATIYRLSTEQALLRLTPAIPQNRQLNLTLGKFLLARMLAAWGAGTACIAISLLILDADSELFNFALSAAPAFLLLPGLVLGDFSKSATPVNSLFSVGVMMLPATVVCIFFLIRQLAYPLPWSVLGGLSTIAAALLAYTRWNRMMRAPVTFPAGRIS
ncbi:hypothetical protein [Undibacterium terreum]|uniref:Uncharacterized protein n=1 Tax=Undibacterium terreum TaxID=1224302 RepID=A0A916XF39_9BURK|nr:hypothetical protein [Undibacterium terreum]GGC67509.1 hypothetical protein GCM10011396_13160 [Undibacterium terreum]